MCHETITTYTTCACSHTSVTHCEKHREETAEAERHYRDRHPWIHDSDDESYAKPIDYKECPSYSDKTKETKEIQGSCVFCQAKEPSEGVRMTKFLDEMEAKMLARCEEGESDARVA